ncbi:hypothetical protein HYU23_01555 [Candidatus Woesearchaeota archaeon]|nr:hypothetical protein [Candidatus Woesearchaeota archaeon]
MKGKFELNHTNNGRLETLIINEISKQETKNKVLLGSAYCVNIGHCAYLGTRHCNNFLSRVKYYFLDEEAINLKDYRKMEPNGICVEFYSDKK